MTPDSYLILSLEIYTALVAISLNCSILNTIWGLIQILRTNICESQTKLTTS